MLLIEKRPQQTNDSCSSGGNVAFCQLLKAYTGEKAGPPALRLPEHLYIQRSFFLPVFLSTHQHLNLYSHLSFTASLSLSRKDFNFSLFSSVIHHPKWKTDLLLNPLFPSTSSIPPLIYFSMRKNVSSGQYFFLPS